MPDEDDIPVSEAMIDAGRWLYLRVEGLSLRERLTELYRTMEHIRRAEAAAEVIRRSVKDEV